MRAALVRALALGAALLCAAQAPTPESDVEMSTRCASGAPEPTYPQRALYAEQEGSVVLSCTVVDDRSLGLCRVVSENPAGWGFGEAALNRACAHQVDAARSLANDTRLSLTIAFRTDDSPAPIPSDDTFLLWERP